MKWFLLNLIALTGVFSLPLNNDDPRWNLARDDGGKFHLVDLNPVEQEVEPLFDPINDMFFLLFTRDNPTVGQRITFDVASITSSNWRRNQGVRFTIHGWGGSATSGSNTRPLSEFLARADHNIVVVDWSVGAGSPNYVTARNNVGAAGQVVGQFIDWLNQNDFLQHSDVLITGHSLGSHVAGHGGKNTMRGKIRAIFGTDPAGPLFTVINPNDRLDIGDADYTEAIHTNAGVLGFDEPITHAAFYPNWGSSQPGCGIDVSGNCAHARATFLYAESINRDCFVSRQCASYDDIVSQNCPGTGVFALMGGDAAKPNVNGVFFLETNAESPFGLC